MDRNKRLRASNDGIVEWNVAYYPLHIAEYATVILPLIGCIFKAWDKCIYVCMYVLCMCVCMYVCMSVCMNLFMYVCLYVCM